MSRRRCQRAQYGMIVVGSRGHSLLGEPSVSTWENDVVPIKSDMVVVDINQRMHTVPEAVFNAKRIPFTPTDIDEKAQFRRNFISDLKFINFHDYNYRDDKSKQNVFEQLKKRFVKNIKVDEKPIKKLHNPTSYYLGPSACYNLMKNLKSGLIRKRSQDILLITLPINISIEREARILCNTSANGIFINIDLLSSERHYLEQSLNTYLNVDEIVKKDFEFWMEKCQIVMRFEANQPVDIVTDAESSKHVLDFDYFGHENVEVDLKQKYGPNVKIRNQTFDENELCKPFRKGKVMFDNLFGHVISYNSLEEKEEFSENMENLGKFFVADDTIDCSKEISEVSFIATFNLNSRRLRKALVKFKCEEDLEKAIEVFERHFVSYERPREGIDDPKRLCLQRLPNHVNTDDYLKWFVRRILLANNIDFISAKFIRVKRMTGSISSNQMTKNVKKEVLGIIQNDLALRSKFPSLFIDDPVKLPFSVEHLTDDESKGDETFEVKFIGNHVQLGCRVVEKIMDKIEDVRCPLHLSDVDNDLTFVVPNYRVMMPISRRVRGCFHSTVKQLDADYRHLTNIFPTQFSEKMGLKGADKFSIRVVEKFSPNEKIQFIGIEGWDKKLVEEYFLLLKNALQPLVLSCENEYEELTYGVGENWLLNEVQYRFEVVIDIDRFNNVIYFIGSKAAEAIEYSKDFKKILATAQIQTAIPVCAPFFNDRIRMFLGTKDFQYIENMLSSKIVPNKELHQLEFEGPLESYKILKTLLNELNEEVYQYMAKNEDKTIKEGKCPICQDTPEENFHRLECGHVYCRSCVNSLVKINISEKSRIRCSFSNCNKQLLPEDIKNITVGGSDRCKQMDGIKLKHFGEKLLDLVFMSNNKKARYCPTPDCHGILIAKKGAVNEGSCLQCSFKYCGNCLYEVHLNSCEEYFRLRTNAQASLDKYEQDTEPFTQCPNEKCRAKFQKDGGCNHVTCGYCETEFCYLCRFSAKTAAEIYVHLSAVHGAAGDEWQLDHFPLRAPEEADIDFQVQQVLMTHPWR